MKNSADESAASIVREIYERFEQGTRKYSKQKVWDKAKPLILKELHKEEQIEALVDSLTTKWVDRIHDATTQDREPQRELPGFELAGSYALSDGELVPKHAASWDDLLIVEQNKKENLIQAQGHLRSHQKEMRQLRPYYVAHPGWMKKQCVEAYLEDHPAQVT